MHRPHSAAELPRSTPVPRRSAWKRGALPAARASRLRMPERRRQLIDVARRVFAELGFRGATVRQIAAAAGVTEAVIFQHFPDKNALYAAILDREAADPHADRWLTDLETARAAGDDEAVIRTLFRGVVGQHDRDPELLRLMTFSALEGHPLARHLHGQSTRLYRFLESFIIEGQRRGRFRPAPPALLARAVLGLPVYYIMQRNLFRTPWPTVDAAAIIDAGVAFTLAGLRVDRVRPRTSVRRSPRGVRS